MKKAVILFLFLSITSCFSKGEQENYRMITSELKTNYNSNNFEGIFDLYSQVKQGHSNKHKTTSFYKDKVKVDAGRLKTLKFKKIENDKHLYNVIFEKSTALLTVKLDKNNKISYLLLKKNN